MTADCFLARVGTGYCFLGGYTLKLGERRMIQQGGVVYSMGEEEGFG